MIRVVFDTNMIVSAQFWQGAPRLALNAAHSGRIKLLATEEMLDELTDVLTRSKFVSRLQTAKTTAADLIAGHRALVEIVEPATLPATISDDPDDDAIIACAVGGQADYIITGDDDLLRLGSYQSIRIWTVNQFLELLQRDN